MNNQLTAALFASLAVAASIAAARVAMTTSIYRPAWPAWVLTALSVLFVLLAIGVGQ